MLSVEIFTKGVFRPMSLCSRSKERQSGGKRNMPVDFVPEVGAYRQRIEKELRTLRPKTSPYQAAVGPYAIPETLPLELQRLLEEQHVAVGAPQNASVQSAQRGVRLKDKPETAARLRSLEEQILEEREGRRQVEEQIDRLQVMLRKLADKSTTKR